MEALVLAVIATTVVLLIAAIVASVAYVPEVIVAIVP